ncbi:MULTISPECIES: hypothetical protein [Streptomyces]|uniref:Uncharacterized protein n=1 Tax=Streptomyces ramulosus TaxID=47762 RepID=A0ABW1FAL7_9ACTN
MNSIPGPRAARTQVPHPADPACADAQADRPTAAVAGPGADSGRDRSFAAEPGGSPDVERAAFRLQVQPEFHAIPLGLGQGEEAFDEQMRQFARDYWGEEEEREPLRKLTTALYSTNSQELAAGGTVYNAFGVFRIAGSDDEEQPSERISRASLTISVRDLDNTNADLAAAGIAETLEQGQGSGEVQLISLPAGPAVVHIAGSRAVWELSDGEHERHFVRIEIWMPFPDEDRLLLLCLSTADVQDLFFYQSVLADVADTITFGESEEPDSGTSPQAPASL